MYSGGGHGLLLGKSFRKRCRGNGRGDELELRQAVFTFTRSLIETNSDEQEGDVSVNVKEKV